jgi:hypothetical protein
MKNDHEEMMAKMGAEIATDIRTILVREGAPHQQTRNCLTVIKSGLGP